jgi:hypothetical protein
VALHQSSERIVEATVKAIVNRTDGVRLQVDYGKEETALVELRQVRVRFVKEREWRARSIFLHELRDVLDRFLVGYNAKPRPRGEKSGQVTHLPGNFA